MPLLDHFRPPLHPRHHWDSFPSNWATRLADALNGQWLPPDFLAEEHAHLGSSLEIAVATYEATPSSEAGPENGSPRQTETAVWSPPAPYKTLPALFPDSFEVRIFAASGGLTLVAAIELVSPGNKDRSEARQAFAVKCASYLHEGVSLIVMDIVTSRHANLHNDIMRAMEAPVDFTWGTDKDLYAVAYRPVRRGDDDLIDFWPVRCELGQALPTMPLRLTGDLIVPVDFESTYQEACQRRRIA